MVIGDPGPEVHRGGDRQADDGQAEQVSADHRGGRSDGGERHGPIDNADNGSVAAALERVAALLEAQTQGVGDTSSQVFRVRAWRLGAETIRQLQVPIARIVRERGQVGVEQLPHIGPGLASAIVQLVEEGRLAILDRLEGLIAPEDLFMTIPGIGEALARRIHLTLHIESLEDLEAAAHDGRLQRVPGFGARRTELIRQALAARLARRRRPVLAQTAVARPAVGLLLDVDHEYRRKADSGELPTIAPRRFNPGQAKWLPVLHTSRGPWHLHALFSNTARAHELGKTHDWVVIYYDRDDDDADAGQCTVVSETRGPRRGERVVRGRESEGDREPVSPP